MMIKNQLNQLLLFCLVSLILQSCTGIFKPTESIRTELRAPAYPLITIDPYTSAWSESDQLFDSPVKHWTGKTHSLIGSLRVDGQVYRFLGKVDLPWVPIVPSAKYEPWEGQYTFREPMSGWEKLNFNDERWIRGKGAFGTKRMPALHTLWQTKDIWVRREFVLPEVPQENDLYLIYSHDDIFELYLNGTQLVETGYEWRNDVVLKIERNLLVSGSRNVIAVHCHNRTGGAYVDFGLFTEGNHQDIMARTAIQKKVALSATKTFYDFTCGPVDLNIEFVSPLLMNDLDLLSRPVNYINYKTISTDGKPHDVQIYFETTPEWAVNEVSQEVVVDKGAVGNIDFLKAGTTEQAILEKKGDNLRIDWGYLYMATQKTDQTELAIGDYFDLKNDFTERGRLESGVAKVMSKMTNSMQAMAFVDNLGVVGEELVTGFVMLGYDDIESIQYFGDNLKAWWTQDGKLKFSDVLKSASDDHEKIIEQCANFDNQLWNETLSAGGKNYADLCVLAYRQAIVAHKLVRDKQGNILFLSKENFSNGSIGTVDVTYPSAPLFLKYNPELLKGMLNPIFYYSESGKWNKPFAAHDVGTYPQANGQTYGGDMPVEECGNMLILAAAIAESEGNAAYAAQHWDVLTTWANYLLENGFDPENQLCTDDFAGHFAHNTNLSVKAIMGIASFGKMAKTLGKPELAEEYSQKAKEMAGKWVEMAYDGDHYRLTFDKPDTWSQKYNMVWDKLLRFHLFPAEVVNTELAYYLTRQNKYGLPLDNRRSYTKSDWICWTATLAGDQETFRKFIDPLHAFITETPNRVPMTDWYRTTTAEQVGFQARSVVGGYFIKLLEK